MARETLPKQSGRGDRQWGTRHLAWGEARSRAADMRPSEIKVDTYGPAPSATTLQGYFGHCPLTSQASGPTNAAPLVSATWFLLVQPKWVMSGGIALIIN